MLLLFPDCFSTLLVPWRELEVRDVPRRRLRTSGAPEWPGSGLTFHLYNEISAEGAGGLHGCTRHPKAAQRGGKGLGGRDAKIVNLTVCYAGRQVGVPGRAGGTPRPSPVPVAGRDRTPLLLPLVPPKRALIRGGHGRSRAARGILGVLPQRQASL